MAKRLQRKIGQRGMNKGRKLTRYPWDEWFKKMKFRLTQGKQFQGQVFSMSIQVRNAAKRRGIKVSISMGAKTLDVSIVERIIKL